MPATITVDKLIKGIADHSDIFLDGRCAAYLQPLRGPLLTALEMEDGETIASTVTRAIQAALASVGFRAQLTPDLLRELISEPTVGVRTIHDAMDKRENALSHLMSFVNNAGRGPFSGAQRSVHPPVSAHAPSRGDSPSAAYSSPQRVGSHASSGPRLTGAADAPREVPAPNRQATAHKPHPAHPSEDKDDNPFPAGRPSKYSNHNHSEGAGASNGSAAGHRASVSNLDEQRAARRSYAHPSNQEYGHESAHAESADDIQNRRREQKNVYGSKASVQFSAAMTKATDRKPSRPTIYIEAARILNPQNRTYDWNNKIKLQMTAHEMQIVTALLFGLVRSCKFANHGVPGEADKWFEFAHQDGQYAGTIKIATGKASDVLVTSMGAEDIGDVTAMFLRQCAEQMRIDQAAVPSTLRVVAQAYNARLAAKSGSRPQGEQGGQGGGGQRRHG